MSPEELLQMCEFLMDRLDEGIHVVDPKGVTILYNRKMADIESMQREDVMGRSILEVFRFPDAGGSTLLEALRGGHAERTVKQTYFNKAGKAITTLNRTFPIYIDGRLAGAAEIARDITQVERLQEHVLRRPGVRYTFGDIIGRSPALLEVIEEAKRATRTHSSVLIVGETGTGKEMFAQSIHQASARSTRPFVSQNCAALPETLIEGLLFGTSRGAFTGAVDRPGLLEQADGGTLLLDEINALAPALQAKLLRAIQEKTIRRVGDTKDRPVDVRIIATLNEDPLDAVAAGRLRKDLYYRLSVVTLFLPPLRERKEDIPLLAHAFLEKYNRLFGLNVQSIAPDVMDRFLAYAWPGNVRELEHTIEGAMNLVHDDDRVLAFHHLPYHMRRRLSAEAAAGEQSTVSRAAGDTPDSAEVKHESQPADLSAPGGLHEQLRAFERRLVEQALERNGGNISAAARELGLSRQSLQYRLRRLGLRAPE